MEETDRFHRIKHTFAVTASLRTYVTYIQSAITLSCQLSLCHRLARTRSRPSKSAFWWFKWNHFSQALTSDLIFLTHLPLHFICSGSIQLDMNVACFIYMRLSFISLYHLQSLPLAICINLSRSRQVHLLRTAGDEVTITVRYLREVPSFLKLPLGKRTLIGAV